MNSIDQSPIEEIMSINEKESESSIIQNDSHIFSSDSVLSQDVKEEVGKIEATEQGFDSLEIVKAADEESPITNDALETTRGTISYDPVMDKLNMVLWAFFGNEPSKSRQNSVSDSKDLDDKTSANPFIYADLTKEEWKELVDKKNLRNRFLQELDHRRGANALLDAQRYRSMCVAMEVRSNGRFKLSITNLYCCVGIGIFGRMF